MGAKFCTLCEYKDNYAYHWCMESCEVSITWDFMVGTLFSVN
jgi:hypothetical protein